jgi:hypothetical protein
MYNIEVLLNLSCSIEVQSQVFILRIAEKLFLQVEELIGIVKAT